MGKISKTLALLCIAFSIVSLGTYNTAAIKAQQIDNTNSQPSIEWQKCYGDHDIWGISNVIQTSDGGYAFVDSGWLHNVAFHPATLYRVDSSGDIQWKQTITDFGGWIVIQTNDNGFEILGRFIDTEGTYGGSTPNLPVGYQGSIVKTDSKGNIQWIENYTSKQPNLNVPPPIVFIRDNNSISLQPYTNPTGNRPSASITKTDSVGNIQWKINATFNYYGLQTPAVNLISLIETSDGSIVALGVGTPYSLADWQGNIYLVKTEPFLPQPSPSALQPPIPTPIPIGNLFLSLTVPLVAVAISIIVIAMLYRRHRKTAKI